MAADSQSPWEGGDRQGAALCWPPSPCAPAAPARKPIYFVLSLFSKRTEARSGGQPRLLQPLPREREDGGGGRTGWGGRVPPQAPGQPPTGSSGGCCPCKLYGKAVPCGPKRLTPGAPTRPLGGVGPRSCQCLGHTWEGQAGGDGHPRPQSSSASSPHTSGRPGKLSLCPAYWGLGTPDQAALVHHHTCPFRP